MARMRPRLAGAGPGRGRRRVRLPLGPQAPGAGVDAGAAGLEWLFRLSQEPLRLLPRYLRYNPAFVAAFARQYAARARARSHGDSGAAAPAATCSAQAARAPRGSRARAARARGRAAYGARAPRGQRAAARRARRQRPRACARPPPARARAGARAASASYGPADGVVTSSAPAASASSCATPYSSIREADDVRPRRARAARGSRRGRGSPAHSMPAGSRRRRARAGTARRPRGSIPVTTSRQPPARRRAPGLGDDPRAPSCRGCRRTRRAIGSRAARRLRACRSGRAAPRSGVLDAAAPRHRRRVERPTAAASAARASARRSSRCWSAFAAPGPVRPPRARRTARPHRCRRRAGCSIVDCVVEKTIARGRCGAARGRAPGASPPPRPGR